MWANKLLSRNPTEPELNFWGNLIAVTSDLATVAFIAEGDRYLSVTQARFVESTLATAPGTVIVTGPQVISAGYGPDGSGTVVLAARVVPPAVGGHLVVSNDANPAAGGVGKVTVLTPSAGDQTTVQVVAAGLTDAFASGELRRPGRRQGDPAGCGHRRRADRVWGVFHGDIEVGYLLGIDTGGWAKANIGMTAGLEAGIEVKARLTNNPGWEADAYLDANLNLEGNLLGGWKLDHNLSNTRLKAWRIADGLIDQDTPDGGTYKHGEDSGAGPPAPSPVKAIDAGYFQSCALKQNATVACWGCNSAGQLGDGTDTTRLTPTPVVGL